MPVIDEVFVASGDEFFKRRANPFPITGPRHFHPHMATPSKPSCRHFSICDGDSDSDASAEDVGDNNALPSVPLNARKKPQFADSKFGRTEFIEPDGPWSELRNHYGNRDGNSPWAYNKYQDDKKWYHPFRDQFSQSQEEVRLRPLQALFQAQCLAIEAELVPKTCLKGWPVLWETQCAYAYPTDFLSDKKLSETDKYQWIFTANARLIQRVLAIKKFAKTWGTYLHFGEVPDIAEVLQVTQKDISKVFVATPATTTGVPASSTAATARGDCRPW